MKMTYMYKEQVCTIIQIDFLNEKISVVNYVNDPLKRAFGVNENPTWEDFKVFLESRCISKNRANMKWYLQEIDVPCYDPLLIIEKTKGRMAEDHQWIDITY